MTSKEIREKYLRFFENKGHKIIPSGPLVPQNDPTVLFTTAGMHPLVPYLLGEKHPLGKRIANSQKCIRTGDIDEVGDNTHLTFFEMLGNWSLGDYFKEESIKWSFEFLTEELGLPIEKLAFTVFQGEKENDIPKDEEASEIWQKLGVKKERIAYLGREDNWWGPAGETGPCGPDTEMFYWIGKENPPLVFDPNDKRWVEIWNNVFMQYNRTREGRFEILKQKNVDTGMGLERTTMILQGKNNVYETELFEPIINNIKSQIENLKSKSEISNVEQEKAIRIVADHIKASVFILAEGLTPSNTGGGYVLRKLIRRAIYALRPLIGDEKFLTAKDGKVLFMPVIVNVAQSVIEIYEDVYPELKENLRFILNRIQKEEESTYKALEFSIRQFDKMSVNKIDGKQAFDLFQSYGLPIEITLLLAKEREKEIDVKGFEQEIKKHQELSRTASAGQFKSGLADNSEMTTKYHTATHLLLAALRDVLGNEVQQKGSNITSERIRFDFNFERKLSSDEISQVENLVNEKIKAALCVVCQEMTPEQAKQKGALGVFGHKYGEMVKVYSVCENNNPDNFFSKEICAGPHAENTFCLGVFKIIKEESASQGVRRIKAVLS